MSGAIEARPVPSRTSTSSRAFLRRPPVGANRWREPQPVAPWTGVRQAKEFGPRCAQARIYDDMVFRDEVSEDCLYLNVWAPARRRAYR